MNRSDFLKCIAETGYNVGFGAKNTLLLMILLKNPQDGLVLYQLLSVFIL
jgi:hypothetical protein